MSSNDTAKNCWIGEYNTEKHYSYFRWIRRVDGRWACVSSRLELLKENRRYFPEDGKTVSLNG